MRLDKKVKLFLALSLLKTMVSSSYKLKSTAQKLGSVKCVYVHQIYCKQ